MQSAKPTLNTLFLFFLALFVIFASYSITDSEATAEERESLRESLSRPILQLPVGQATSYEQFSYLDRNDTISSPAISAQSAYVWDRVGDKVFFEQEADERRPIASITKLMTAAVVIDQIGMQEEIELSLLIIEKREGDNGFQPGEVLSARALLHAMLMISSNDAALILAEYVSGDIKTFVALMNQKRSEIGLTSSYFTDPTGLNDTESFSTARDIATLVNYLRQEPAYAVIWEILKKPEVTFTSSSFGLSHTFVNNNPFILELRESIGGKTGYTELAGESLVLLIKSPDNEGEIVYIVLGSNDRFGDMRALINWIGSAYVWVK